jgi:hypothetical protein
MIKIVVFAVMLFACGIITVSCIRAAIERQSFGVEDMQ